MTPATTTEPSSPIPLFVLLLWRVTNDHHCQLWIEETLLPELLRPNWASKADRVSFQFLQPTCPHHCSPHFSATAQCRLATTTTLFWLEPLLRPSDACQQPPPIEDWCSVRELPASAFTVLAIHHGAGRAGVLWS